MRRLQSELNSFSEGTTLHGFAYLSKGQTLCTRIIWSLILLGAAGVAGYFLYQTVKGYDENYTSTKIETRSIKEFPFPAVTFHPGDFHSNRAFLQMFLNQLGKPSNKAASTYRAWSCVCVCMIFCSRRFWMSFIKLKGVWKYLRELLHRARIQSTNI